MSDTGCSTHSTISGNALALPRLYERSITSLATFTFPPLIFIMDFQALLVVLVLGGISAIPFIIMWRKRKRIQTLALAQLSKLAESHGGTVSRHEHGYDFTIGVDDVRGLAMFIKHKDPTSGRVAELSAMSGCRVLRTNRKSGKNGDYHSLDKIELAFTPRTGATNEVVFTLFSVDERVQPGMELEQAESWARTLQEHIAKK